MKLQEILDVAQARTKLADSLHQHGHPDAASAVLQHLGKDLLDALAPTPPAKLHPKNTAWYFADPTKETRT